MRDNFSRLLAGNGSHLKKFSGRGNIARRSLNLLMKLPKPLWAKALRVFLSQQIFLAEKNQ